MAFVLLLLVLAAPSALAADVSAAPDASAAAHALARRLMSPYCPGLTLADCQSSGAVVLREEIRTRLESGESIDQITEALVGRFGSRISGQPAASGVGLFAWTVPPLVAAATLLLIGLYVRRSTPQRLPDISEVEDSTTAARVTAELEGLD